MQPIRIVLVRPRNPNNIGAAARAMANFGLDDLVVVDPYEPVWRETKAAVGGEEVLQNARKLSLPEALRGAHLVLGTSTGRRRKLDAPMISLPELASFLEKKLPDAGQTAILFGSEKTGLRNEDLQHCRAWLKIPTSPDCPSINLGQAVAIVAYELSRNIKPKPVLKSPQRLPAARQLEDLMEKTLNAFQCLDYQRNIPRPALEKRLRQSLLRWNLTRKDAAMLQSMFKRISQRLGPAAHAPEVREK